MKVTVLVLSAVSLVVSAALLAFSIVNLAKGRSC